MAKSVQSKITKRHYLTLSDATSTTSTVSVYGKLVEDAALNPTTAGILHPRNSAGAFILAQVVGFSDQGRCQGVVPPLMVTLPEPDGPADGCGWDPSQYVVWKNLPKNWVTLHLHAEPRSLGTLLSAASSDRLGPAVTATLGVRDMVNQIVKKWASMSANPLGTDVLQTLWAASNPSGPFSDAAQDLATRVNQAFGTHLLGSDINPPGSIKTVDDLVSAIT